MPDNSNLPKPNIPHPNPPAGGVMGGANSGAGKTVSGVDKPASPTTPASPTAPASPTTSSRPTPPTSPTTASSAKAAMSSSTAGATVTSPVGTDSRAGGAAFNVPTAPAGLDPQSPGGAPPQLNAQGQVTRTSTISQTPTEQNFKQTQDLPVSKLQQLQQAAGQTASQAAPGRSGSVQPLTAGAINPTQEDSQAQAQVNIGSQQAIRAAQPTPGQQKQAAMVSHSSLGGGKPSVPGSGGLGLAGAGGPKGPATSTSASADKDKDKKKGKIKLAKDSKKTSAADGGADFAQTKKPILKYILFGLAALLIVGAVVYGITQVLGGDSDQVARDTDSQTATTPGDTDGAPATSTGVVLTYWGLFEPESVMKDVLSEFEQQTGISVDYRQQSHKEYRTHLQSAIAAGSGPDVFRFHASWTPMLKEELAPMPARIMSVAQFEQAFYPTASQQLQVGGQLVGVPLMHDGLGLYYNTDILRAANEQPPATWAELRALAVKLTVRSAGQVERGGLAIGNAENVDHFSDILGLLIYQNGGNPAQPMSSEVRDAIQFYADFSKEVPVFSTSLPNSTVAFARGELAMMFAPSWRVHEIQAINPDLNFDIAPVPQLSEERITWASYWAEGVNSKSQHKDEAWQLLKYLSSEEVLQKLYSNQSQIRAFGEIYPKQEMASKLAGSNFVSAYLTDAPYAKSWYMCSRTHDEGLNDRIIDYYQDAVNAALARRIGDQELQTLSQGVNQVLRQYGL